MIHFSESIQVYVNLGVIDFRRGLDGLLGLVESTFGHAPQEPYLFLFRDRSRRKIKALFWDKNGFMLLYKRLETGKFQFPKNEAGNWQLSRLQLECLLSGMSFFSTLQKQPQKYSVFS
jgi:transposase